MKRSTSSCGPSVRLEALEGRLVFSVIVVDSLADGPLSSLAGDGKIELREAIELATKLNTQVDGYINSPYPVGTYTGTDPALINTIRFAPSLAGQTINLIGVADASVGYSAFGIGNGAQLTIDGETGLSKGVTIARPSTVSVGSLTFNTPNFRLATVPTGSSLTLKGLTVRNFVARGFDGGGGDSQATGGGSAGMGGAIWNQGNLTIQDSTFNNNLAQGGAGGSVTYEYVTLANGGTKRYTSHSGSGGAGLTGGGAAATADDGSGGAGGGPNGGVGGVPAYPDGRNGGFGGGGGGAYGSGIWFNYGNGGSGGWGGGGGGGSEGDDVIDNIGTNGGNGGFGGGGGGGGHAGEEHGGLAGKGGLFGGDANNTLGGGGAGMGGAIFNWGGAVSIINSTFTANAARGGAGGTTPAGSQHGAAGAGLGGAILSFNGSLTVIDSTISDNASTDGARGVAVFALSGNASAIFNNNIIGQSDDVYGSYDLVAGGNGGTATIIGQSNLIRTSLIDAGSSVNRLQNTINGDPKLGPLQDNGGLTPTRTLLAGSAAIDAGDSSIVPVWLTTDQRGAPRVRNYFVDLGAVESRTQQTITFGTLANKTYGDADFAISATSSSNLPVTFTASGGASVYQTNGVWYVHITGAGSATITATAAGNADYEPALPVAQTLTIAKAASTTTTVGAGPFTYNGAAQVGGSGTVTGAGGLNTTATSLTYSANADGTGTADFTNAGTYYVTAHYAGDANHLASDGVAVAVVIKKADATVKVSGYSGVYDGAAHGATGTATGVGGASVGTLNLGATFTTVPGGTAHWSFDGGRNYVSQQGDVAITILAKHITASFTAANKVYDGTRAATVTSRTLNGVVTGDAVALTGGTATFATKNVGTQTVTLTGATLTGTAAKNYILDSVATTTATITPKPLTGTATTPSPFNVASNGVLSFSITLATSGIVDGQTVTQLFSGAPFTLTVAGKAFSVPALATVSGNVITVNFAMTSSLKTLLAATTTATTGAKATSVAMSLAAMSKDGNYSLGVTTTTMLFNTGK